MYITRKGGNALSTITLRLGEILKDRNITQKAFAEKTGLRPGTLNSMVRGTNERITLSILATIMKELEIDDINTLMTYSE